MIWDIERLIMAGWDSKDELSQAFAYMPETVSKNQFSVQSIIEADETNTQWQNIFTDKQ